MASNSFGKIFRITTWGESHGKAIGVVIDGCPAGIPLDAGSLNAELRWRAPGKNPYTSPRNEEDRAEIYSGVFEGITTGAPISIIIPNRDQQPEKYEPLKDLYRPGHANYTYLQKYGVYDYRGGGRASARETACRVAAGAVAKKILESNGISIIAYIKSIGDIIASVDHGNITHESVRTSPVYCPDENVSSSIVALIDQVKNEGDSLGGVVEVVVKNLPPGLGDPVYCKIEGELSAAYMSIPATKGVEIGSGFEAAAMRGSCHNDSYTSRNGLVVAETNHCGGVLGGITTGAPLIARVCFKPPSSINKPQHTVERGGKNVVFTLPEGSRHDPCVAIRGVPVVEAMTALVIADALLYSRCQHFLSKDSLNCLD